jgi:hypothetical protein
MAEHGCGAVVKGRGKNKNGRVRIYPRKRFIELRTGRGWKPGFIYIKFFLEPCITRDKSTAGMFFVLLFLLGKCSDRCFEFGSRIQLPIGSKKKFGVVDEALFSRTGAFILQSLATHRDNCRLPLKTGRPEKRK